MFERRSMEQALNKMIKWTRGTTTKITDFRVGSKLRTIYESVGVVIEEFYDRVYRAMKEIIEENIYSVFSFDRVPSRYASGLITFSRSTEAEEDYYIPAGTLIQKNATEYVAPMNYRTTQDVILQAGTTSVDAPIVCDITGEIGNTGAHTITDLVTSVNGVEEVTNRSALINGEDEETKEAQKLRFQRFSDANARGVLQSIEYGATLATREDEEGTEVERVVQAKAIEYLPERLGEVDLYVWNGVDGASEELIADVDKIQLGYYDEDGKPIYGYKPAGIIVYTYVASMKHVTLKVDVKPHTWTTAEDLEPLIEQAVDDYFGNMKLAGTLIQTELESDISLLDGVWDVKLYLSTNDGEDFDMENVSAKSYEIIVPKKPIIYGE